MIKAKAMKKIATVAICALATFLSAAAASAQYALDRWHPAALINLGTCGGIAGRVERFATILATKTVVYDIVEQMGDAQAEEMANPGAEGGAPADSAGAAQMPGPATPPTPAPAVAPGAAPA